MATILFIIAQRNFRDEELSTPKKILEKEGHRVEVASITANTASGMLGSSIKPDLTVKAALKKEYDGVVVVGGSGAPELADYPEVVEILQKADSKHKLIASICMGPVALAKAGILQGKKATVWSSSAYQRSIQLLKDNGARYSSEKVVVDGRLITAFGPDDSERFGQEIADWLADNA